MHIAVCDDNIADRKQTERLLGRQSDRIFKESGERLYIDSYGNVDAFMQNPQMYHALFVDMVKSGINGLEVTRLLLEAGIVSPIILCVSEIDYRQLYKNSGINADNIFFLDKPILVAELTSLMDEIRKNSSSPIKALELRGRTETIYAKNDDIVCVKKSGSELIVYLENGKHIEVLDEIYNLYDQCNIFPQICPVSDSGLVNINHVSRISFGKIVMDNGVSLPVSLAYRSAIREAMVAVSKPQANEK